MGTLRNPRAVENLRPYKKGCVDHDDAVRRGKMGGQKRAENARKKKELKESLELILQGGHIQDDMCLALVAKALAGDVRAFEVIRDTLGQKPAENINVSNKETLDKLDEVMDLWHTRKAEKAGEAK